MKLEKPTQVLDLNEKKTQVLDLNEKKMCQEDIMTDFASQRPLLQEQILLHELNHRVNNEFATAISIVSRAAASSNDKAKGALSRVADLLHRFADVHRALQMPEYDTPVDAAAYLRQLCRSISRSQLDSRQIELVLAAQPLRLSADRCWRLGMIVFELINNAARHAFPGREGEIRVELLRVGAFAKCSVTDNGSAAPTVRPGRGLKIIDELSKSLGGRCIQKFEPRGSWSILAFPCHSELIVTAERPRRVVRISEHAPQLWSGEPAAGSEEALQ
ncbi:MAG TPA: sensor histidine kinase [Xanthobacteraceae bacterium]|nr:sensor histidine kinase [Xanthobacteraceae bacterium]